MVSQHIIFRLVHEATVLFTYVVPNYYVVSKLLCAGVQFSHV